MELYSARFEFCIYIYTFCLSVHSFVDFWVFKKPSKMKQDFETVFFFFFTYICTLEIHAKWEHKTSVAGINSDPS